MTVMLIVATDGFSVFEPIAIWQLKVLCCFKLLVIQQDRRLSITFQRKRRG